MPTYISILRGINVTGHKMIKMKDLIALYESVGFTSVVAYIQSGNLVFKTNKKVKPEAIAASIEKAILDESGFEVPVIILSHEEMKSALEGNDFLKRKGIDASRLYFTFLEKEADKEKLQAIPKFDTPDEYLVKAKVIYLYCPGGYGNTKLSNTFFENKLKVKATTRNLNTVKKLIELSAHDVKNE
jgi:uncharacterized protein (DUF1697 family)